MDTQTTDALETGEVILPPKVKNPEEEKPDTHEQFKVVWPKELTADIRWLAEQSGRSIKDASEKLMRWAVERAKAEYEMAGEKGNTQGKHNKTKPQQ